MIKKLILIVCIVSLSYAVDYKLQAKQISENIYMFIGINDIVTKENGGNIANTFWIKTKKHYIVIDSGASYLYAQQAHKIMKKISDLPIKFVVNSHMHDDHWMGNNYYKKLNIPIYATQLQNKTFPVDASTRILNQLDKKDLIGTKIVSIDNIVNKNFTVNVDGTDFNFIYLKKPAHTKEDFMVYVPSEKALFTGDLLFSQRITSIRDGSIEGSIQSLKVIENLDVKIYANGHGKYTDETALNHMKDYLGDLKKLALLAIEDDIGLDEFVKNADMSKYKDMILFERLNKANLDNAFREYEFFDEE